MPPNVFARMLNDRILKGCADHIEKVSIKSKESLIADPVEIADMDTLITLILTHEQANPPGVEAPGSHALEPQTAQTMGRWPYLNQQIEILKERVDTIEKYLQGEPDEPAPSPAQPLTGGPGAATDAAGVFQASSPHPSE